MEPYIVRQGDTLASIAHAFGFDPDPVWNDDKNADLRKLRPNPNILFPTDVLYIPDQAEKDTAPQDIKTGTTNSFVADAPPTTINIRFLDPTLASQPCTIAELEQLTGLTTTEDGSLSFSAPVTLDTATVTFTGSGATWTIRIGHLDPINTLAGIYQRLQGLGHLPDDVEWDESFRGRLVSALGALRASQQTAADAGGGAGDQATSSPLDDPPQDAVQEPPPDSTSPAEGAPAIEGPDADPGASLADTSVASGNGLSDDGTLDDETTQLLLKAFGC